MPQELKLVTAAGDRTACLWDTSSDIKLLQEFQGHTHSIKSVVFRHQDKGNFIKFEIKRSKLQKTITCKLF